MCVYAKGKGFKPHPLLHTAVSEWGSANVPPTDKEAAMVNNNSATSQWQRIKDLREVLKQYGIEGFGHPSLRELFAFIRRDSSYMPYSIGHTISIHSVADVESYLASGRLGFDPTRGLFENSRWTSPAQLANAIWEDRYNVHVTENDHTLAWRLWSGVHARDGWKTQLVQDINGGNLSTISYHGVEATQLYGGMVLRPEERLFGLEIEANNVYSEAWADLYGYAFVSHDGSCGEEIVTIPLNKATVIQWIEDVDWTNVYGTNNCGVHVHVSRKDIPQEAIDNMIAFIKDPSNWEYLDGIAQREQNHFCDRTFPGGHYDALNTSGKHTVEFRIFAGSHESRRLTQIVEWVDNFVQAALDGVNLYEEFNPNVPWYEADEYYEYE